MIREITFQSAAYDLSVMVASFIVIAVLAFFAKNSLRFIRKFSYWRSEAKEREIHHMIKREIESYFCEEREKELEISRNKKLRRKKPCRS